MRQAHSALLFLAAVVLASCNAASSRDQAAVVQPAGAAGRVASGTPPSHDPLAGLVCPPPAAGGALSCKAPGFDVAGTLDACDTDSTSFGAIETGASVMAIDRLVDGQPVARLGPGQFVCIQFHADPVGGGEGWVYVTAISPETVPACKAALCGSASARSSWIAPRADECGIEAGRYTPGCPGGWVRSTQVDAYSMGL